MDFHPFPCLSSAHQQTVLGWVLNMPHQLESVTELVLLPDNDQIACEVTTPASWEPTTRTVFLLHGLCGSHTSPFLVRNARRIASHGYRVVRVNMRGSGTGAGLARKVYHCGQSDDLFPVLKQFKWKNPDSPFTVVGFSLGGNIGLKAAGENPSEFSELVDQLIGLCPATDILTAVRLLGLPENKIYEQHFIRCLKTQLAERYRHFPDLPVVELPDLFSLFEFDQLFTAPQCGFRSALDYYRHASASRVIPNITTRTEILFAADDPFIDWTALNGLTLPRNLGIHLTRKGGHMGFIGHPAKKGGYRWMDSQLLEWIQQ